MKSYCNHDRKSAKSEAFLRPCINNFYCKLILIF